MAADALHVTLCFLGYHPERAIETIAEVIAAIEPRPVAMRFEPDPVAGPRAPAAPVRDRAPSEAAAELQRELAARLAADRALQAREAPVLVPRDGRPGAAGAPAEGRLAPTAAGAARALVERPPGPLPDELLQAVRGVRVTLYRSHLRPSGAEYVPLAVLDLPPATSGRER